ncbi:MAG: DUF1801 domain-containing protein [Caulobacter sp.]|nr:DUF1801 domain-containing protein [Caulobacter sp.]
MTPQDQIQAYIAGQPEPKRQDLQTIHQMILQIMPGCALRFLDGRDTHGKVVSNPNIGYGSREIRYADGSSREFYRVGLSANTTGISIYILGLDDKKYLSERFGKTIGKASVTGYCIRFKAVKDLDLDVLEAAIRSGVEKD